MTNQNGSEIAHSGPEIAKATEAGPARHGRAEAWQLLTEWTQGESLRKHALAVETCVAACGEAEADRLGLTGEARTDLIELYAATALLHDMDYERHPSLDEHPFVGVRELERLGWPEAMRTGDAPGQVPVCLR
jgi:predicted hydrolase (HD superfamily)